MKVLVQQTRSQCANEVRKRERIIEGLKKHVGEGGRPRGSGKAVGVRVVDVVPGVGEISGCEKDEQMRDNVIVTVDGGAHDVLSSELEEVLSHLRTLLTNPSFVPLEEVEVREEEIIRLRDGWEKMETRWKEAVTMMDGWRKRMARSGQTVNLEELKMGLSLSPLKSGEEIERLGLSMIGEEEGEGDTQADIDAMSDSEEDMVYDEPLPDPADIMVEEEEFEEEESSLFADDPVTTHQNIQVEEEVREQEQTLHSLPSSSPGPPPQLSPLRETNGNASKVSSSAHPNGPQKDSFTTIVEENTYDLLDLETKSSPQKSAVKRKETTIKIVEPSSSTHSHSHDDSIDVLQTSTTSVSSSTNLPRSRSRSPEKTSSRPSVKAIEKITATPSIKLRGLDASSRLPRPQNEGNMRPQQSPLTMATIAAKLAATEREADAARVRAKLKAARLNKSKTSTSTTTTTTSIPLKSEGEDGSERRGADELNGWEEGGGGGDGDAEVEVGKKRKAPKAQGGRANRRRSTLSPWEMESLILGGLGAGGGSPLKEG